MSDNYFFVDLDGTIISTNLKIDDCIKNLINSEKDINIVLATGRASANVRKLDLNVDAICSNGSEIVYASGEVKKIAYLDYDKVEKICEFLNKENMTYVLATEEGNIINEECNIIETATDLAYLHGNDSSTVIKGINIYYDIIYENSIKVKDAPEYVKEKGLTVSKVEFFTAKNKENLKLLCENVINDVYVFSSHISNVEIVPLGISKAEGIRHYLGDKLNDSIVYAIGDEKNDIEMLKLAHQSFAVKNACQQVLEIVDVVVDSVDNNGFLQAYDMIKRMRIEGDKL